MNSGEISFYVDCLIVETILGDDQFIKQAQDGSTVSILTDKIKEMVNNHIDPNDKVGSLINFLGPGVIWITLKAFNFNKIGFLIGLAINVFHIDLNGIIKSIWSQLKPAISEDKKISSNQIDNIVQNAVQ